MADNDNHIVKKIRELLKDPMEDGGFMEDHQYNQVIVDEQRAPIKINYVCKKKKKIVDVDGTYQVGCGEIMRFAFRFKLSGYTSCF